MANRDAREALRGAEEETFDLLAEVFTPRQWAKLLRAPLENAAAKGDRALSQKLVGAGAKMGEALHKAARGGHGEVVSDLLEAGASMTAKDTYGRTPFTQAVASGNPAVVQLMLRKGADINETDSKYTPLHVAVIFGHVAIALALVAAGADVNLRCGQLERSAVHAATLYGYLEILKVVIERGADVNAQDNSDRYTPLHHAAAKARAQGAAEMVDFLLRSGADDTILNAEGEAAADLVGIIIDRAHLAMDVTRVCELLANAPADRAWRRRGYLVLCRAHPDRDHLRQEASALLAGTSVGAYSGATEEIRSIGAVGGSRVDEENVEDWRVVVARVLGLQEEEIFRTIVEHL